MIHLIQAVQEDSATVVDTLSESYSDQWAGAESAEQTSTVITAMASHDLIFIVLGVSLIIWFVLLFFIIRTDRNVSRLEEMVKHNSTENAS
jgi:type IV secretory pathway VirB6-like protein